MPVGFTTDEQSYYYKKNAQGDVVAIIDTKGILIANYTYDAWGNITAISGDEILAQSNPFRYRGYYQDNESGFFYLQSRYYDSAVGRFLNADHINLLINDTKNLNINLYSYVGNNAIIYIDPTGESLVIAGLVFTVGAIIALCTLLITAFSYVFNIGGFRTAVNSAIIWAINNIVKSAKVISDRFSQLGNWAAGIIASIVASYITSTASQTLPDIARKYGNLKCKEAVEAMKLELLRIKLPGAIVELYFPNAYRGYVLSYKNNNIAISQNGRHYGVLFNGRIYCNIYPTGLPQYTWINSFYAASDWGKQVKYYWF